jgi:hypothetical protein
MNQRKFVCPKCGADNFSAREMVKLFVSSRINTSAQMAFKEFELGSASSLVDDELSGPQAKDWACQNCHYRLTRAEGRALLQSFTPDDWHQVVSGLD